MALDVIFPPGYGQFSMKFQCDDSARNAFCTFAFRNIPGLTAEEADEELRNIWYVTGRPAAAAGMSDQWRALGTYTLLQNIGFQTSFTFDANTVGTETSAVPGASQSVVVNKRTPNAGKRFRGRFGWPPFIVAEEDVDAGGRIGNTKLTILQGRFTAALNAMNVASLPMVLLHTRIVDSEQIMPTLVTSLTVNPLMGIQRKRGGR